MVSQAMESDDSRKWINSLNEELKSIDEDGVWDLVEFPTKCKKVDCKWSTRPSVTQKTILNAIRQICHQGLHSEGRY